MYSVIEIENICVIKIVEILHVPLITDQEPCAYTVHGTLYLFNTDLKNEGFLLTSIKATSG